MTSYELNIGINSAGLKTLNAASQQIAIVKKAAPSKFPIIWIAFTPELSNQVTWEENYFVYGSSTKVDEGATIVTDSTEAAQNGNQYPFVGGQFKPGKPVLGSTQYGVNNLDEEFPLLTAGLAQISSVSPTPTPLNATVVPYNDFGTYVPVEIVYVFANAVASNGLVISDVQSNALEVNLTTITTQQIHYDSKNNVFSAGPLPT